MNQITAKKLYNELLSDEIIDKVGNIVFSLAGTSVIINTTDTVGNSIQNWLGQWMKNKNIYCDEPPNTQEFPDFYLSTDKQKGLLEVKAFNFNASPAFDIANFESYCESVANKPYRLDADYLIFGYTMSDTGEIRIKKIWLKKIWEIAGTSGRFALNTQVKRDVIYNIRPRNFKVKEDPTFHNEIEFLNAIYETLIKYRGIDKANEWKNKIETNYKNFYNKTLELKKKA